MENRKKYRLFVIEVELSIGKSIINIPYSEIIVAKLEFDGHIEAIMNIPREAMRLKANDFSEFGRIREKIWRVAIVETSSEGSRVIHDTKLMKINQGIVPQPVVVDGRRVKYDEQDFFRFKKDYFGNNYG